MIKLFFSDKPLYRILKNKFDLDRFARKKEIRLELDQNGQISIGSKNTFDEHLMSKVLDALALGFELESALHLFNVDFTLISLNVSNYRNQSQRARTRARIIGAKGRTKKTIEQLSGCDLIISGNVVSILGKVDHVKTAVNAVESLLRGSKTANVYSYLERSQEKLQDLEEEDIESVVKQDLEERDRERKERKERKD
jgi:ribosomal RNA assembly protein